MPTLRWLLPGILMCALGTANAATVQRLSTQELSARSSLIFIGTVEHQETALSDSPKQIWTTTQFRVERLIKGEPVEVVSLRQLGGVVGEGEDRLVQKVHGYPSFRLNERVLLFLETADTGNLVVTGLSQGKFSLTAGADPRTIEARRDLSELRFPNAQGRVYHLAGMPSVSGPIYLDQVIDIVEGRRAIARPIPLRLRGLRQPKVPTSVTGGAR